jgi:hypothetical protein
MSVQKVRGLPRARRIQGVDPGAHLLEHAARLVVAAGVAGETVRAVAMMHAQQFLAYRARVDLVPVDGYWKVRTVELLDEERLR